MVLAIPGLWMFVFFVIPFLIVLKISLSEYSDGIPPYSPLFSFDEEGLLSIHLSLSNYFLIFEDDFYLTAFFNSIKVAFLATIFCLLIGFPMAYAIAKAPARWKGLLLVLVILPFWTSFLIRVYSWIGLLKSNGLINHFLMSMGLIDQPIQFLHTEFALYLGVVYSYLPFMILPLYTCLDKMDHNLLEAAADLGAKPWKCFFQVTIPLALPGIIAGSLLVFIPVVGEFVIPDLLGPSDMMMIGKQLWIEFFQNRDWPLTSALAILLLMLLLAPIIIFQHYQAKEYEGAK